VYWIYSLNLAASGQANVAEARDITAGQTHFSIWPWSQSAAYYTHTSWASRMNVQIKDVQGGLTESEIIK